MCIVLSRNMGIVSLHFKDSNATLVVHFSLHRFSIRPDAVLVVLIVSIYGTTLLCASFVYKPSSSSSSPSIASSPNKSITCTAATTTTTTTTVTQKTTQVSNKTTPTPTNPPLCPTYIIHKIFFIPHFIFNPRTYGVFKHPHYICTVRGGDKFKRDVLFLAKGKFLLCHFVIDIDFISDQYHGYVFTVLPQFFVPIVEVFVSDFPCDIKRQYTGMSTKIIRGMHA